MVCGKFIVDALRKHSNSNVLLLKFKHRNILRSNKFQASAKEVLLMLYQAPTGFFMCLLHNLRGGSKT